MHTRWCTCLEIVNSLLPMNIFTADFSVKSMKNTHTAAGKIKISSQCTKSKITMKNSLNPMMGFDVTMVMVKAARKIKLDPYFHHYFPWKALCWAGKLQLCLPGVTVILLFSRAALIFTAKWVPSIDLSVLLCQRQAEYTKHTSAHSSLIFHYSTWFVQCRRALWGSWKGCWWTT